MPKKNELIPMEITGMTHEGSGVGHLEGMAVFVPGAAVGDTLLVRIVKVNKSYCFGRLEQILTPSPDRILPDCPVSSRCGGCVFRHVNYAAELRYKGQFVQQNLRRIAGIALECEPAEPSPRAEGYRNKAQYPVRAQNGTLCAGFFAPRSHAVVDCHECRLQPPVFSRLLNTILRFCEENGIPAYDEGAGTGLLRHVYLRQGAHSKEMMVCLICNGQVFPKAEELIKVLRETAPETVSVLLNVNRENTNVILGRDTHTLFGKAAIEDTMCGLRFSLSPHAFYQVNTEAAERLYAIAAEYAALTGRERVLDLYCGVGTIGLSMASQAKEIIGVEIVPQAVENAASNAAANGITNARFFCADAGEAASRLAGEGNSPDVVVLDPPRKGCDAKTLEAVARMGPERIVYISCNSATFSRDCAALLPMGYELRRCRPVDLFPRTAHVETVCLLSKFHSDKHIEVDIEDG